MKQMFKITKKTFTIANKPRFLKGVLVQNSKGEDVAISDCWKKHIVVLKVLRRFGCPLCRYESRLLSELKAEFDALDIKLVAIGFERVGLEDFLAGGFWSWEVLIDCERSVHMALGVKKMSVSEGIQDLMSSSTRAAVSASVMGETYGDLRGDSFQLGGTYVIEKKSGSILYEFRQAGVGHHASLKEIYSSCGGDPEQVEEKSPRECITYRKA
ncbi:hypothetical protein DSO57_1025599 [Entomophthora muscae]|uniref:Uncharacterized protein n=1 Tax=Entomophthora muscae TaxID=34485 RepID=A0ACC2U0Q9_9FUNG|nr:hypothetical protein DSO57_1025599 [Entomophthora muscae]